MDEKYIGTKKVAVLIDAENISLKYLDKIFTRARSEGNVCFKRIYGKVKIRDDKNNPLLEFGITHIQCYSYVPEKNTADMVLAVDAMDQLYKNGVDVFCIVSSDSDFAPLVNKIIEEGRTVIGMGESKTVKSFRNSCNEFILLDGDEPTVEEKIPEPDQVKADIEEILSTTESKDGWVRFKLISDKLNKKYTFNPSNYDCETMVELLDRMGFDVTYKTTFGKKTYYARLHREPELEETVAETEASAPVEAASEDKVITETSTLPEAADVTVEEEKIPEPEEVTVQDSAEKAKSAEAVNDAAPVDAIVAVSAPNVSPKLVPYIPYIIDIFKEKADNSGYVRLTTLMTELQKRCPDFSAKKAGYGSATKLAEALGCKFKNKGTSNSYVKLGKDISMLSLPPTTAITPVQNEASAEILDLEKLVASITEELKEKDGWTMLSKVMMELKKRIPGFIAKQYGAKNSVALVEKMPSVQLEKRYSDPNNKGAYDAFIRVIAPAPSAENEDTPEADGNDGNTSGSEPVTEEPEATYEEIVEDADSVTVEVEQTAESEAEEPEVREDAAEEEEEEEPYVLPSVDELPEEIGTIDHLRDAFIFVYTHESVSSPTRLTAAMKRYYPDFKIKDFGYTKMKNLLEDLGLFFF